MSEVSTLTGKKRVRRTGRWLDNPWQLSEKEGDILEGLIELSTLRALARVGGTSIRTVENQLKHALDKMQVLNKYQAVIAWSEWKKANERKTE